MARRTAKRAVGKGRERRATARRTPRPTKTSAKRQSRPSKRRAAPGPKRGSRAAAAIANPLLVEVTRGEMVESRHRVAIAVLDAAGKTVEQWGDIERPIYARSAIKPLQALPLLETGAAARYGLDDREIALACASHSGEPQHTERVAAWLARIGCTSGDLECGPQLPYDERTAERLIANGGRAAALYNNCSGKHTGFLSTARHKGEPTAGYIRYEHPVQRRITKTLGEMAGIDLARAPRGIDGCGIPVLALPLRAMALALARLADPAKLPAERRAAAARIVPAMMRAPEMVGGSGRFGTRLVAATGHRFALKGGAEGVYAAILPSLGLGVALKADDGAGRAAEVAMARVLARLEVVSAAEARRIADLLTPPVKNRAGLEIGRVRLAAGAGF
jgi:L-asparaginase II